MARTEEFLQTNIKIKIIDFEWNNVPHEDQFSLKGKKNRHLPGPVS